MFNEKEILRIIGRKDHFFDLDIKSIEDKLKEEISSSSFLVVGGAGSIGREVTKEIVKRGPELIHVVDINENNLVELIRDLRSSDKIETSLETFSLDSYGMPFELFLKKNEYDYVLNLSAIKHVRAERDPYTILRMIEINILNTIKILSMIEGKTQKYFCVSTDKASNPVSMMGASKRIMELFLSNNKSSTKISSARFANVAFSDGSLLDGFVYRFMKKQPLTAPKDIKRYFITPKESGELCMLSTLMGNNNEIYFPKLKEDFSLTGFHDIALNFLEHNGYEPFECNSEDEARENVHLITESKKWPCYFFQSDTSGEKAFEEFFTKNETPNFDSYNNIGIVKSEIFSSQDKLDAFLKETNKLIKHKNLKKIDLVNLFNKVLPNFDHIETGRNLDQKM